MRIYASGEAQRLNAPGEFLPPGSIGRVIGLIDLGANNSHNEFGWSGLKAVINVDDEEYVLDFPEHTRLVTDDGIALAQADAGEALNWWPERSDLQRYGLRLIELAS